MFMIIVYKKLNSQLPFPGSTATAEVPSAIAATAATTATAATSAVATAAIATSSAAVSAAADYLDGGVGHHRIHEFHVLLHQAFLV